MDEQATRLLNPDEKQNINGNICRVVKNNDYTTMSNVHLRDKKLSLKAKGLLSVVLSLPKEWNYSVSGLVSILQEGEFSIKSTLKELQMHKYLLIRKISPNKEVKVYSYEYVFFESPALYSQAPTSQELGNQALENQTQLNTDKLNTNKYIYIASAKNTCEKETSKPKREKTALQEFSNQVIERFENLEKHQIPIWFRRNCRCLTDILNFCGGKKENIPLALECINTCCKLMQTKGFSGAGYEAVCRNLPYYYQEAKKTLRL